MINSREQVERACNWYKKEWVRALDSHTDCILVKRGDEWHVRQYKHSVSNGMPYYRAVYRCAYSNLQVDMPVLYA